jgi:hypothetical protein
MKTRLLKTNGLKTQFRGIVRGWVEDESKIAGIGLVRGTFYGESAGHEDL